MIDNKNDDNDLEEKKMKIHNNEKRFNVYLYLYVSSSLLELRNLFIKLN